MQGIPQKVHLGRTLADLLNIWNTGFLFMAYLLWAIYCMWRSYACWNHGNLALWFAMITVPSWKKTKTYVTVWLWRVPKPRSIFKLHPGPKRCPTNVIVSILIFPVIAYCLTELCIPWSAFCNESPLICHSGTNLFDLLFQTPINILIYMQLHGVQVWKQIFLAVFIHYNYAHAV